MTDDSEPTDGSSTEERADELRDLFEEVTDETTVTEEREEERGTLRNEDAIREDLRELVEEAVEALGIDTSLAVDALVRIVEGYFDGEADAAIADAVDAGPKTVRRARVQLHLLRDADLDAPVDLDELRERVDDASTAEIATELDVAEGTVRFYRRVVEAERAAGRAGDYRDRFASALQVDASDDLTSSAQTDGLQDATEDMEVDVDL